MQPTTAPDTTPRLAARCRYLRVTLGDRPGGNLLNVCKHIIRDGRECVGPFLDEWETTCGFWEGKPAGEH
ncbi:MAG: hypothetical protein IT303_14325 [Dehalococcoidia bacterium]|nr:hypothetical protein [Dehalococcoidia bacterium]